MKNRFTQIAALTLSFALIVSLHGCSLAGALRNESDKEQSSDTSNPSVSDEAQALLSFAEYISFTDKELTKEKGDGEKNTVNIGGDDVIIARTYSDTLFDYDANALFAFSDGKAVGDVVFTFDDASFDEVSLKIVSAFGEPSEVVEQSEDTNEKKVWISSGYQYTLLDDGTNVTLTISKSQ